MGIIVGDMSFCQRQSGFGSVVAWTNKSWTSSCIVAFLTLEWLLVQEMARIAKSISTTIIAILTF